MGKYSVKDSPKFDALVDAHMERIVKTVYGSTYSKHWKALILRGDYARGEGTPKINSNGEESPFGEYNLVIITRTIDPLIKRALYRLESSLSEEIGLPVHLTPYQANKLKKCAPSLANYKMKQNHRVLRGAPNILSSMPDYTTDQIPLSEGTRLLLNHGARLLEIKSRLASNTPITKEERHRFLHYTFDTNLAFGESILLIRGAYSASTKTNKKRINDVDLNNLNHGRAIVDAFQQAIGLKEQANTLRLETENIHVLFEDTARRFEEVFLWYERRRLNRKFRTLEKYSHEFPNLGKEGSPLKNAVKNLRTFGISSLPTLFVHPRIRLYAVLPLLLAPQANQRDIRWFLKNRQETNEDEYDRFRSIQDRFA